MGIALVGTPLVRKSSGGRSLVELPPGLFFHGPRRRRLGRADGGASEKPPRPCMSSNTDPDLRERPLAADVPTFSFLLRPRSFVEGASKTRIECAQDEYISSTNRSKVLRQIGVNKTDSRFRQTACVGRGGAASAAKHFSLARRGSARAEVRFGMRQRSRAMMITSILQRSPNWAGTHARKTWRDIAGGSVIHRDDEPGFRRIDAQRTRTVEASRRMHA